MGVKVRIFKKGAAILPLDDFLSPFIEESNRRNPNVALKINMKAKIVFNTHLAVRHFQNC